MNERIKELRKHLKLSQQEFATKISLSRSYLANIELGNQEVKDRTIKLICKEFSVNEEWLRFGTEPMFKIHLEIIELFGEKLDELDEMDKKIIIEYLKLNSKHREVIKGFIRNIVI